MACRCQTLPNLSMEGGKVFLTFFDLFLLRVEQEWQYIRNIGIDLVQGYYFGRPAAEPVTSLSPASCL